MSQIPAQVLVVDDELVVRRVLGDALAQAGHRVRAAGSAEEALARLAEGPADLVLLDLQLGDSDGVEVMRCVRERWPQTQIIILTAHGSMGSAIAAVRHGAADYLLKPVSVETLRARVAEVLAQARAGRERQERIRSMYLQLQALVVDEGLTTEQREPAPGGASHEVFTAGPLSLDVVRHQVRIEGHPVEVTPTEFAILHTLIRNPGAVVTCTQIVQSFQGNVADEDEARQILRPHIVRLRRKLERDPSQPAHLQAVRGVGYRWQAERGEDDGALQA